jgi:hypothetical protein
VRFETTESTNNTETTKKIFRLRELRVFRDVSAPWWIVSVASLIAVAACAGGNRLEARDAQRMIEQHPRFRAAQTIRVPTRYCGIRPTDDPATPPDDPLHTRALESNRVITLARRPAVGDECGGLPATNREVFQITLTDVASTFHPTPLQNGRGWEFAVGRRQFISVRDITYNDDDPPTIAHVGYAWRWMPELLGQLLQIVNDVQLGASATFRRTSDGWRIVQPGM